MSSNQQKMTHYLTALKTALAGQPASLIQDACYDAECHLLDALAANELADFDAVVAAYGEPDDIAQQYLDAEAQTQLFLTGPVRHRHKHSFFEPLFDPASYQALGYFLLAFPLSLVYFAWLAIAGMTTLGLSLLGVGIPLLALYLKLQSFIALFEGRLIAGLLGERMPRRPYRVQTLSKSWLEAILSRLKAPIGWKTSLYMAVQLPLSGLSFMLTVCLFFASVALMLSPVVDPLVHYFAPQSSIDLDWYFLPLGIPAGLIGLTLSLWIANALARLQRAVARSLLVN